MSQIYTIVSVLFITSSLGLLYHSIFWTTRKNITLSILRAWCIGSLLLIVQTYFSDFLIGIIAVLWLVSWYLHPQYRRLITILLLLLVVTYLINSTRTDYLIFIIVWSVTLEEVAKSSWISLFSKEILPYDGIIIWILLWSFFWIFEAWWAWRLWTTQEVRMRVSSSLSIHTVVTTTLLWIWIAYKKNIPVLVISCIWALSIHGLYNYFQWTTVVLLPIILLSYILISYWISKIDRIYI
jgi:hypothetical protein